MNTSDERYRAVEIRITVFGNPEDGQRLWELLSRGRGIEQVGSAAANAIYDVILDQQEVLREDFDFETICVNLDGMVQQRYISADRTVWAAVSELNAELRAAGRDELAQKLVREIRDASSESELWHLIRLYRDVIE